MKNESKDLISKRFEVPKSAYILILLLYIAATITLRNVAGSQSGITILGTPAPLSAFAGVFSSLSNICVIFLVVFFGKLGFITAILLLAAQFPHLISDIVVKHNVTGIPGIFTNVFTILAVTIIYTNNAKIRKFQNRIRKQAVDDALTGLPNRFAFTELIHDLKKKGTKFSIVSIDLNNFKSINDTMGNAVGDQVLISVAERWKKLAESGRSGTIDFVARLGGDEYAILIRGYSSDDAILNTIKEYKAELEQKLTIDDCDFFLNASFGYALYPDDYSDETPIFSCADAAMHAVKMKNDSEQILRFDRERFKTERSFEMERIIRTALENDNVIFNLQPQYDINHNLRGFEALARMKDQDGKLVSPGAFIPVAESCGLIDQIDLKVFEKSATFIAGMVKEGHKDLTLSINISVRHLMKNNFLEEIRDVIEKSGIDVRNLEIEVTESIMIDSENALKRIESIKDMGIRVAIDDFGTGYSSLSYLNKLPADLLKIDKSFIDEMNSSESSRQYVASIISIGHILNLEVISEGVEDEEQLKVLKGIGCDYIQGFVWGRPLPEEEALKLIKSA